MTSACLPGVSVPIVASSPFAFAPSIVAHARTSDAVSGAPVHAIWFVVGRQDH
jgi:hypothetical protein